MFKICDNKGVHFTFINGWTVSIQWGGGNYYVSWEETKPMSSETAEVWAWKNDEHYPENPLGYQNTDQVLRFMQEIREKT